MACLEKPIWNEYTRVALSRITITKPNQEMKEKVLYHWDTIAKPIDGMGRFETLIAQIGAITGTDKIDISKKAVIIMCADNGIVEEQVSQVGQEVTLAVVKSMAKGQSSVGKMASVIGVETIPVDIGVNSKEEIKGILNRKIRCGTRNFRKEPAMLEEEMIHAIAIGIDLVGTYKEAGIKILATGEMGIGNTATSSAIVAALLKCDVHKITSRGAGLSDEGLFHKQQLITEAIEKYHLYDADVLTILKTVGGLDIAGLVGICIGGALFHIPIVLDGMISLVAALLAEKILSGTKDYLLPSHKGKEPIVTLLLQELGLEPVIDGQLALGEGTGAVMLFALLDMALSIYHTKTTFSDIQIGQYKRFNSKIIYKTDDTKE